MNKNEKILEHIIVVTKLSGDSGSVFLKKFITLLKPLCRRLYIVSRCPFQANEKDIKAVYVPTSVKSGILSRFLNWLLTDIRLTVHVSKEILKTDVLVIIGTDLVPPAILAKLLNKKVIIVVIGSATRESKEKYGELLFGMAQYLFPILTAVLSTLNYILAYRIVVLSRSMITNYGLSKYNRKILSNGALFIDNIFFKKKPLTARTNIIGFVGRLEKEKGIVNFVSAIPLVLRQTKGVKFFIVGTGKLIDEVRNVIGNYTNVRLFGWVPNKRLPRILNEIKLLVVPSHTEGLPAVVLEAMACGVPVLATAVGGIPDVIKDGKTGFLLRSNDPKHIAEKIVELLNRPELLEKVSKNAYEWVRRNFSYENALGRWREILQKLF